MNFSLNDVDNYCGLLRAKDTTIDTDSEEILLARLHDAFQVAVRAEAEAGLQYLSSLIEIVDGDRGDGTESKELETYELDH